MIEKKLSRSAEKVKTVLNLIFETALNNDAISKNPMQAVTVPKHYRTSGRAMSFNELTSFIDCIRASRFFDKYLFLLFTGCRLCELSSMQPMNVDPDTGWIKIPCAKVKGDRSLIYRKIPIFPNLNKLLRKYVSIFDDFSEATLRKDFKNVVGTKMDLTVKDLRHTFVTLAKECGVSNELVATWVGHDFEGVHRGKVTSLVYTHFSEDYQKNEAQKIDFTLDF